jgi:hypothetical protein
MRVGVAGRRSQPFVGFHGTSTTASTTVGGFEWHVFAW